MGEIAAVQTSLLEQSKASACQRETSRENNRVRSEDRAVHEWYRFVLSFPPHVVREYVDRFGLSEPQTVLDPFCGTGTTLVECKKLGLGSIGIEANPMPWFATNTKIDWSPEPSDLVDHATRIAEIADDVLEKDGIAAIAGLPLFSSDLPESKLRRLPPETEKLILTDSISPLPLHRVMVLLDAIDQEIDGRFVAHEKLALAKTIVSDASNLHFGPEVGVGKAKTDAPVTAIWLDRVREMASDLLLLQSSGRCGNASVFRADSRETSSVLAPCSIDAVITSPPYPNEKDYTRTTRLESVLMGFTKSKADLRAVKQNLVRSNTRSVYQSDTDHELVREHAEVQRIAAAIEARRIELQKTSGFERLYAKLTKLYFGGMHRHLADLRPALKPGAHLAYVVGDQASYLRVMIRTGQIIADIAASLGYEVERIDLFRTRLATATGEQLREEVVVLRWPGIRKAMHGKEARRKREEG